MTTGALTSQLSVVKLSGYKTHRCFPNLNSPILRLLTEDLSSVPSIHTGLLTAICNSSSREFNVLSGLSRQLHTCSVYLPGHAYAYVKKKSIYKLYLTFTVFLPPGARGQIQALMGERHVLYD